MPNKTQQKKVPVNAPHWHNRYKKLEVFLNKLAKTKLGFPVSLLSSNADFVDNEVLGIKPGSIASILINNVGDPFQPTDTYRMDVKEYEIEVIRMLAKYYGLSPDLAAGYVTSGGTESNFACLWWSKKFLINQSQLVLAKANDCIQQLLEKKIKLQNKIFKEKNKKKESKSYFSLLEGMIQLDEEIIFYRDIIYQINTPTVFCTAKHTHYSIFKIAQQLGLQVQTVNPELDGSMHLLDFIKKLRLHMKKMPYSAVIVSGNIGTTVTGAVDNIPKIRNILEGIKPKIHYTIHLDAALSGAVLPVVKPFGEVENYFNAIGVNTLAVSGHKFFSIPQPCGIALTTNLFLKEVFQKDHIEIEYPGRIQDITVSGSRSGMNVLLLHNTFCALGVGKSNEKLLKMVQSSFENAVYLYHGLVELLGFDHVLYYPNQFNVIFSKPSMKLIKKYQLMISEGRAIICVLQNVNKKLIEQFLVDLNIEIQEKMMKETTDVLCQKYKFLTLQEKHVKEVAELFTRAFCDGEPLTKHLNTQYDDFRPFALSVTQKAKQDGFSIVAVDEFGKVVACALSEDLADPFMLPNNLSPKLDPIFGLLESLSQPFMEGKKFMKGKIAHTWVTAVHDSAKGQGLSTRINAKATIDAVLEKGFSFVYAEFTSAINERFMHTIHADNQIKINTIQFKNFKFNKKFPFVALEGCASSYIWVVRPGVQLNELEDCLEIEREVELSM